MRILRFTPDPLNQKLRGWGPQFIVTHFPGDSDSDSVAHYESSSYHAQGPARNILGGRKEGKKEGMKEGGGEGEPSAVQPAPSEWFSYGPHPVTRSQLLQTHPGDRNYSRHLFPHVFSSLTDWNVEDA